MKQFSTMLLLSGLLLLVAAYKREDERAGSYLVTLHPYESASQIAHDLGFDDYKHIGPEGSRIYLFTHKDKSFNAKTRQVESLSSHPGILFAEPDHKLNLEFKQVFNDPQLPNYWHLKKLDPANLDINVYPAWARGIIGQGVIVGIFDSGIYNNHSDVTTNVDPTCSISVADGSSNWQSSIPTEGFDHGTFVAATVAGQANNSFCGLGVAYGATLGALKATGEFASDVITSLGFQSNKIWIRNYSVGFAGCNASRYCQLDSISQTVVNALEGSVTNGRTGKGSISVWAASNEGDNGGDTNMSGFTASRCNLAVAATGPNGVHASYSNLGAGVHVAAPGGDLNLNDLQGSSLLANGSVTCTQGSGTSFAAPVVSGIIALMLQQNANLGWRDVKEILLRTAVKNDPNDTDWTTNGAGYHINNKYGFGYVNTDAAVKLAANWTNLPAETLVTMNTTASVNLAAGQTTTSTINVGQSLVVEHVQVVLTITGGNSSAFNIVLKSPAGTSSTLLQGNVNLSTSTFNNWVMLTVRNWGESATGSWALSIFNQDTTQAATLTAYTLAVYGRGSGSTTTTTTSSSQSSGAASLLPFSM